MLPLLKRIRIIGIICYIFLISLAILFYKERCIILDMAFHAFEIIRTGDFVIPSNRYSVAITQVFPVLACKMQLPLYMVLALYSVSFVILHFVVFLFCSLVFKDVRTTLVILLFSTLMFTHAFYWIPSEYVQGLVVLIFYFAFIIKKANFNNFNVFDFFIMFFLLIGLAFFHPLIPIPFIFLCLFFRLHADKLIQNKLIYISFLGLVIILIAKNIVFPPQGYEASLMSNLKNFKILFPHYLNLDINYAFIEHCLKEYYFMVLMLFINIFVYVQEKDFLKLSLLLAFFFGYLLLVNVSYYHWFPQCYIENAYLPLSLFIIIPFIFDVLPLIKNQKIIYISLIIILVMRTSTIAIASKTYTERLKWNENLLAKTKNLPDKKLVLSSTIESPDVMLMSWGSSFELLLLSASHNPDSARSIIVTDNPEKYQSVLNKNKTLFTEWKLFDYNSLPKRYFNFHDTSSYKIMSNTEFKEVSLNYSYKVIREEKIKKIMTAIQNAPDWLEHVKEKAKAKGVPIDSMIKEDATFMVDTEKQ